MSVLATAWLIALLLVPAVYWPTPERFRSSLLTALTLAFLALFSPASAALLAASTVLGWFGYRHLSANSWAIIAIAALQMAPLIFCRVAQQWPAPPGTELLVPLGLSYFALRAVHYVVEAYKGTLPRHGLADVVHYMFFLPTLVAGPIHRFPQFLQDQQRRRWNSALFSEGLERVLYGYVKVTFIANLLINDILMARIVGSLPPSSHSALYITMIGKGLNGYFQFAGYSDIAIGFARLLGFRVMENFNWPLIRRNVQEFWSAWHISLTSWCRDYVYTPAFSLTRARWIGIFAAMAVLGLWHEFTSRYLIWGIYNAAGIVAWHQWRRLAGQRIEAAISGSAVLRLGWTALSVLLTLHFIFLGFTLVQHEALAGGLAFAQALFGLR